ncbi:MAG: hypothetical protein IH845_03490 [Nanoarchaeota archaeon]|nr:hypothetical protein [Nanoarchaeota archaeon]
MKIRWDKSDSKKLEGMLPRTNGVFGENAVHVVVDKAVLQTSPSGLRSFFGLGPLKDTYFIAGIGIHRGTNIPVLYCSKEISDRGRIGASYIPLESLLAYSSL